MEYLNGEIILNVWLAMLIYNIIFKAFGATLLSAAMKGKKGDEVRKTFKEKLEEAEKKKEQKTKEL